MEQAIEIMKQSVHEPRHDGKANPLVGAVIYTADGSIETACRGELRYGDHAEYTLLERKKRSSRLDGAILFTTLEPCSPGARRHLKLSCAERIILARIKEVWVGIEDPDPTVDRKGIKYLQDNGVVVHMFDRGLQEVIRQENADFISQAEERAAEASKEKKPRSEKLSGLEDALPSIFMAGLSSEALVRFKDRAKISDEVGSPSFNRRLVQQGILKEEAGKLAPTGFGFLVFGEQPRTAIPQAGLLGTIHYPDDKEETRDFNSPSILIPEMVEDWLRNKLPSTIDRSRMVREEQSALPFGMVREAVVNALVHRDYDIAGAKCQIVVTEDTITVKSPGGPLPPVTLEQLQTFNAPMLSRNPELHYVFTQVGLAEERGLGLRTLKSLPEKYGLPIPQYVFEDPYLALTLYRSAAGAVRSLPGKIVSSLSKDEIEGWQFLASQTATTRTAYARYMKFEQRRAQRHLKHFVELGLLRRIGQGPATRYEVVRR